MIAARDVVEHLARTGSGALFERTWYLSETGELHAGSDCDQLEGLWDVAPVTDARALTREPLCEACFAKVFDREGGPGVLDDEPTLFELAYDLTARAHQLTLLEDGGLGELAPPDPRWRRELACLLAHLAEGTARTACVHPCLADCADALIARSRRVLVDNEQAPDVLEEAMVTYAAAARTLAGVVPSSDVARHCRPAPERADVADELIGTHPGDWAADFEQLGSLREPVLVLVAHSRVARPTAAATWEELAVRRALRRARAEVGRSALVMLPRVVAEHLESFNSKANPAWRPAGALFDLLDHASGLHSDEVLETALVLWTSRELNDPDTPYASIDRALAAAALL